MKPELVGLKGGLKQKWLRIPRKEVDKCYFEQGAEACMAEYGMSQDTLRRYLDRGHSDTILNKLSQADKWVLEMARAGDAELRGRVRDLEDWKQEVQPVISFGQMLLSATVQDIEAKVSPPALLEGISQAQQLSGKLKK